MSTPLSITADKDLVQALQEPICNPVVGHSRSEDTFCLSDADNWPEVPIAGGIDQVLLEYPSTDPDTSLPGTEFFCDDYLNWLGRMAPTDAHTHEPVSYMKELDPSGEKADRYVRGMTRLSNFCGRVRDERHDRGQTPVSPSGPTPQPPPAAPQQPSSWLDNVTDFIKDNEGKIIGVLVALGGFLSAVAVAVKKFQTGVLKFLGALAKWENFAKIFSRERVKLEIDHGVVLSQLKGQVGQLKGDAARFFEGLEYEVEKFVTDDVIAHFNKQAAVWQRIHLYLDEEKRPQFGLPWSEIEAYVKGTLTLKNRDPLRKGTARAIADEIGASLDESKIISQFIARREAIRSEPAHVRDVLVLGAIVDWRTQDDEARIAQIDLNTRPTTGVFPEKFVDKYLTDENIERARREAEIIARNNRPRSGGAASGQPPASRITGFTPSGEGSGSSSGGPNTVNRSMLQSALAFAGSPSPAAYVQNRSPLAWGLQMFRGTPLPLAFATYRLAR